MDTITRSTLVLCLVLLFTLRVDAKQQKLLPSDGNAEDQFGYSVAIDGKTVLVGSINADVSELKDSGAAYIYALGAAGWQQEAKLIADSPEAGDTLGGNVALRGNVAMLGASRSDIRAADAGAVFVFERDSANWMQRQMLTAPDAKQGDAFGQSIALTTRFLVIGAPRGDAPLQDSGAAYVYRRDADGWQFQTKLVAADGAEGDLFGISVTIDHNTILVGADLNDEKAEKAGAVYAFVYDGQQWIQQAKLMAEDGADTDIFGVRVALSGDTALISARRDDLEGIGVDAGSAYVFERAQGKWEQTQKLIAPDGVADDRFARGVALNTDIALISAMHHDTQGKDAGAVYVYKKTPSGWRYHSKVIAKDGLAEDRFGWNVGLSGTTAIVATPHRDDQGESSGAAYIVDLNR